MNKINQILNDWPPGTLITSEWLESKGVSRQLSASYVKSGWFEKVSAGVYKRPKDEIAGAGVLYTLQVKNNMSVHIGGKTSLELQGYGHYIKMGPHQKVVLWKEPDLWLPTWFKNVEWDVSFEVRSAKLFDDYDESLNKKNVDGFLLNMSSPERAVMEYLYDIPKHENFDEAHYIMEGMTTLRPSVLQSLLENCRSIKVKRLFLYMAETYNHSWLKYLEESTIGLGSGNRSIVKGGKLVKKYQIVVPEINREDR
ncbi:type IV toxin-antitoxin system AbiEi family antitoxin [Rhodohalobacter sp.]|uniref:type IV toxin-antitoxin system AbiEi family antitoxin n=1 Tax=Rhodohalobacter sp. TaxID=1974210 RepID=UPI0035666107